MKDIKRANGSRTDFIGMIASFFGITASLGSIFLWVIFLFANPYSDAQLSGVTYVIALTMFGLSALGVFASLKNRLYLMYLVFLGSIPSGLYFLLTPGIFKWLGMFCFLYLLSAIVMTINKVVHGLGKKAKDN